jgi:hypothetical protein
LQEICGACGTFGGSFEGKLILSYPFVVLNGPYITILFGSLRIPFWLQKDADSSKRDTVVVLLQDMLEVFTRDMMVNEIRLVNIILHIWNFKSVHEI